MKELRLSLQPVYSPSVSVPASSINTPAHSDTLTDVLSADGELREKDKQPQLQSNELFDWDMMLV